MTVITGSLCKKENFRQARKHLGLSQGALAQKLQTSLQTISNYETGRAEIPGYRASGLRRLLERHEGDRRPAPMRPSHASAPSLDELFS